MKKVLILAYDFPPYVSVGGLRPYNWYRYFKAFDIEPIVITRQWQNKHGNYLDYISVGESPETIIENTEFGKIIKTPYKPNLANKILLKYGENKFKIIRKSISFFYEISQFFFIVGPKKEIFKKAKEYLKNEKVDAIIATGDPFILFHYASKLSSKFNVPWIADYRDPWSFDVALEKKYWLRKWNAYLELKTLKSVSRISVVTNFMKIDLLKILPDKKIDIIPNGYVNEIVDPLSDKKPNNEIMTIGFIGSIYKWNPIKSFLGVINEFVSSNGSNSIRIKFFGINISEEILESIDSDFPKLKKVLQIEPRQPYEKVIELCSNCDMLLLFNHFDIIGTKIYDYIGLRRPILFCYSDDKEANKLKKQYYYSKKFINSESNIQQKIILEKNAGYIVHNAENLYKILNERLNEFKENNTIKCYTQNSEEFSRKHQTGKLAELIKKITN